MRLAPIVAAALLLAGCGGAEGGSPADPATTTAPAIPAEVAEATTEAPVRKLVEAAQECGLASSGHLGDDGYSISFDTQGGDDEDGDPIEDVACVTARIEMPDHVVDHIDATRALDGMQNNSWGDFEARWTYHPDAGMRLTIVDTTAP